MRSSTRSVLLVSISVVAACGSPDDKGLYSGAGGYNSGGTGASSTGGSKTGGSGGTDSGTGGINGGSGGVDGGTGGVVSGGGTGGTPTGGGGGPTGGGGGPTGGGGAPQGGGGGPTGGGGAPQGGTGGGTSSCVGHCGSSQAQPGNCYCDSQCEQIGDCCDDYVTVCKVTTTGGVPCGGSTCVGGVTFCCFNPKTCNPVEAQCSGPDLYCDGPEDCQGANAVCCSTPVPNQPGNYNLRCQNQSECTGSEVIICTGNPSVCPAGDSCVPHPSLPVMYCT